MDKLPIEYLGSNHRFSHLWKSGDFRFETMTTHDFDYERLRAIARNLMLAVARD